MIKLMKSFITVIRIELDDSVILSADEILERVTQKYIIELWIYEIMKISSISCCKNSYHL